MPIYSAGLCPKCRRDDAVQKVSILVTGDLSPSEYEAMTAVRKASVSELLWVPMDPARRFKIAQLLAPLPRPEMTGMGRFYQFIARLFANRSLGGRMSSTLLTLALFFLLLAIADLAHIHPLIMIGAALLIFFLMYADWMKKSQELSARRAVWEQAIAKWRRLVYCSRCDGVFLPGQERLMPATEVRAFLFQ